jgi:hypothetical protein
LETTITAAVRMSQSLCLFSKIKAVGAVVEVEAISPTTKTVISQVGEIHSHVRLMDLAMAIRAVALRKILTKGVHNGRLYLIAIAICNGKRG